MVVVGWSAMGLSPCGKRIGQRMGPLGDGACAEAYNEITWLRHWANNISEPIGSIQPGDLAVAAGTETLD